VEYGTVQNYGLTHFPAQGAITVASGVIPSPRAQSRQDAGITQDNMIPENAIKQKRPVAQTVAGNISNGIDLTRSIRQQKPRPT
jgi:hypothetical protein